MKCNNCGDEITEGMRFCGNCGTPVPQEKKCVSCGATIALRMRFCPDCGTNQSETAEKPKFNAASFAMGDKNVIAGDVIGSQETTHISGNATIIKNEDQTKQVKRCHVCGSLVMITDGFDCPECGEFTCDKCYDADKNCCSDCAKKHVKSNEEQYAAALKAALSDGKIDLEERRILNDLAKKLGLSNEQAAKLEREVKGEDDEGSLTTAEELELKKAYKDFYACQGALAGILSTAQKIFSSYPTNEKALSLYLPVLAASGKTDEVLNIFNKLGADVLSAYITAIDIYLSAENMTEAERALKKAVMLWPENNVLKCYQAYYYLAMYHKYNDFSFLEKATNANAALKDVKGEIELSHQLRVMSLLQKESGEELPAYDKDFCNENGIFYRIVSNVNLGGIYMEDNGGTVSGSNEGSGGTFSFYDNSLDGWCVLHISTKTDKEYHTLKQVLIDNPDVIFSEDVDKDFLIENIDDDLEMTLNEDMYGYSGDSTSAKERLKQLEELCGFKFGYTEIFAGKRVSYNFIIEKNCEDKYPCTGQWYELSDEDGVIDYWAIIECIGDGEVYLAERNTLNYAHVFALNKKTGEYVGGDYIYIETNETDSEVYNCLASNDFELFSFGIKIADTIDELYEIEWESFDEDEKDNIIRHIKDNMGIDISFDDLSFKVVFQPI